MKPQALIAGVHEFPERKTGKSMLEIQALSARAALEDAGLGKKDVDGYFTVAANPGIGPLPIVDYLNLNPKYIDGTTIGGSSFVAHVNHAAAAIAEGRCRVALITYGSTSRSSGVAVGTRERISGDYLDQFEALYGHSSIIGYPDMDVSGVPGTVAADAAGGVAIVNASASPSASDRRSCVCRCWWEAGPPRRAYRSADRRARRCRSWPPSADRTEWATDRPANR